MSNQGKSVDEGRSVCKSEQDEWQDTPPTSSDLKHRIRSEVERIFAFFDETDAERSFDQVEKGVISRVFTLGRLFVAYFLARRHERSRAKVEAMKGKGFHERLPQPRLLGTFFGKVRYWRTYLRHSDGGGGVYPAPQGDGEVLVTQIDSKATPTATDSELEKRRGKREPGLRAPSPRHRGRQKRRRLGSKPRRKKGDKSKNGRAATLVVMYTLKIATDQDGKPILLGLSTARSTPPTRGSATPSPSRAERRTSGASLAGQRSWSRSSPTGTRTSGAMSPSSSPEPSTPSM